MQYYYCFQQFVSKKFINELNSDIYFTEEVLKIITNNSIHLRKAIMNGDFSEELLTEFGLKFGQSLEYLKCETNNSCLE